MAGNTFVVTGGAGFIGSNIARELVARGERVIIVDRITEEKVKNIADLKVQRFIDADDFYVNPEIYLKFARGVFHQGACSDTTHPSPDHIMRSNYKSTVKLLRAACEQGVRVVYASSAAVYGNGNGPLNVYGFSKKLIDDHVQDTYAQGVVGLRYFNVYGPRECHKGKMASLPYKMMMTRHGHRFQLFKPETRRDFVHVSDVVGVNMHFMFSDPYFSRVVLTSRIYDVGSGHARSLSEVARVVGVEVEHVSMPAELEGKYQEYTCADLSALRDAGYNTPMLSLEQGVEIGW